MILLSVDEIKHGLDREFLPLEPMLTGLRLIDGGVSDDALEAFESTMGVKLPISFREIVKSYDFGRLTIGPVAFCNGGDYLVELKKINSIVPWWGGDLRPNSLLMVANSDPFAILINLDDGEVLAMDVELGWQKAQSIARSFDLFVKGIGTTMLRRDRNVDPDVLSKGISAEVGSVEQAYWLQLAK